MNTNVPRIIIASETRQFRHHRRRGLEGWKKLMKKAVGVASNSWNRLEWYINLPEHSLQPLSRP